MESRSLYPHPSENCLKNGLGTRLLMIRSILRLATIHPADADFITYRLRRLGPTKLSDSVDQA